MKTVVVGRRVVTHVLPGGWNEVRAAQPCALAALDAPPLCKLSFWGKECAADSIIGSAQRQGREDFC